MPDHRKGSCQITGRAAVCDQGGCYDEYTATCDAGHKIFADQILTNVTPDSISEMKEEISFCLESCEDAFKKFSVEEIEDMDIKELSDEETKSIWERMDTKAIESCFEYNESLYDFPSYRCPLCKFFTISKDNVLLYLMAKQFGTLDIEAARKNIIKNFSNYEDFKNFLRKFK